jgi:hypothetical protein
MTEPGADPGAKPVAAVTLPEAHPKQQQVYVGERVHNQVLLPFLRTILGSLGYLWIWLCSMNVKPLWELTTLLWNGMFKFTLNLIAVLAFLLFAALFYQIATEQSIVIEPISVPQLLASNGYTPEVAARRLRDSLTKYHEESQTTMRGSGLALHSERPNFVVPTVGLSSEAITTFIRTFFNHPHQQNISGEFTLNSVLLRSDQSLHDRRHNRGIDTTADPQPYSSLKLDLDHSRRRRRGGYPRSNCWDL